MNTAQLTAAFEAHKPAVLGTAAAAVAGLALLQKRKKGSATSTTGGGAPVRTAGATVPAAAVVPGGYDSSATDVANWLAPQLEHILQTTGQSGINSAPSPVASPLFSNQQWLQEAETQWVRGAPDRNVSDIQNALTLYLNGNKTPDVASNGINWAVRTLGAPPEGTKGVSQVYATGLLPAK